MIFFRKSDINDAIHFTEDILRHFKSIFSYDIKNEELSSLYHSSEKISWWIAGLINLSDWLGSSEKDFPFKRSNFS